MQNSFCRKGVVLGIIKLFFVVIILLGSISPAISGIELKYKQKVEQNSKDFDTEIKEYMKKGHMPSLVACVIKDNTTVWFNAYGYRDYYNEKKTTVDTVYSIASVSKSVTATAIMQLNESGLIGLDDNVSEYLGFDLKNPNYPEVNITFRVLLSHESSLADTIFSYVYLFYILNYSRKELKEYLLPGGLIYNPGVWNTYMPGTCSCYSTLNYELLGYLVECISNQPFVEYCQENIFNPLKMHNTSFFSTDFKDEQLSYPYCYIMGFYIRLPQIDVTFAGGGLKTTISDFSHYLIMLTSRGVYDGVRILREESIDEMQRVQYPEHYDEGYLHGFGWYRNETHGGHGGRGFGSCAEMIMRYSDRVAVAYFWNQNSFILTYLNSIPKEQEYARVFIENALFRKADEY